MWSHEGDKVRAAPSVAILDNQNPRVLNSVDA